MDCFIWSIGFNLDASLVISQRTSFINESLLILIHLQLALKNSLSITIVGNHPRSSKNDHMLNKVVLRMSASSRFTCKPIFPIYKVIYYLVATNSLNVELINS